MPESAEESRARVLATYKTRPHLVPDSVFPVDSTDPTSHGKLVIQKFPVTYEGYTYAHSRLAYVAGRPPLPVVLVHSDGAGCRQFYIDIAAFLARVGYVALAVDVYKDIPGEYEFKDHAPWAAASGKPANRLIRAPKYWRGLMGAYLDAAFEHPAVASGLGGTMGYSFGGAGVLEQVRAGHPIQVAVCIGGFYNSRPVHASGTRRLTKEEFAAEIDCAPNIYTKNCKVLIEHGDLDIAAGSIAEFKEEMDSQGIDWQFNTHARTPHGWHHPGPDYTERSARRSIMSMLSAFAEAWPDFPQYPVEEYACGIALGQHINVLTAKL